jgi:hypothetical protein
VVGGVAEAVEVAVEVAVAVEAVEVLARSCKKAEVVKFEYCPFRE